MTAQRRRRALALLASAGLATSIVPALAAPAAADEHTDVIAEGLDNARGMTVAPDGTLYVAESGSGGDTCEEVPAPNEEDPNATAPACFGNTGAITRISDPSGTPVVERFEGLPSLAIQGGEEGDNVIGPSDVSIAPDGRIFTVIGLGAPANVRDDLENQDFAQQFASLHVVELDEDAGTAAATKVADIGDFEEANDPDGDQPDNEGIDTNPYAVEVISDFEALVADAGGNTLVSADIQGEGLGTVSPRLVFPNKQGDDGEGGTYPYQPVPTSITQLNADEVLVGSLAFGGGPGAADVYRVQPGAEEVAANVYESGFNPISGVDTLGRNLFVAELTQGFGEMGPTPGRVVRAFVPADEALAAACPDQVLVGEPALGPFIGGVAVSQDGHDVFVVNGATTLDGTLLRADSGLPFDDVLGNTHEEAINCLAARGLVNGIDADTFLPQGDLSRAQAASLMARLVTEAGGTLPEGEDRFTDDEGSVHEDNINALAEAGIVEGRTATTFEPQAPVTRAQLASLAVRTAEFLADAPLPAGDDQFTDDEGSVHEENINKAAEQGWIRGFTATTFGPQQLISRAQSASVVARFLSSLEEETTG